MATQNSPHPSHVRAMDAGRLQPLIESFASHLAALGHARLTVQGYDSAARHFALWLNGHDIGVAEVDDCIVDKFARHRCRCRGSRRGHRLSKWYVNRVRRFVRFLADAGIVPARSPTPRDPVPPLVEAFMSWLRCHRGITEQTIIRRGQMIKRLLPALGDDPAKYDAGLIRRVILDEAQRVTPAYVKTMITALRGYLRFLAASSVCQPWLDQAVPVVVQWRLSSLPRYLLPADVDRLIASCDLTRTSGVRDRAILLLLARLGLRAGEICDLRLDDVDWDEADLRIRGKGRTEIRLPLPQDAGDALLDYLERGRPTSSDDRIFLRSKAPYRPFVSSGLSGVVELALRRAGISNAPSRGCSLLRHSAATAMLRAGATLDAIGAVLRHRSADTTAHYAKVDVAMLQQIVQPWPGEVRC